MDVCTAGDLGDKTILIVEGEEALSDTDSAPTSDINAVLANTKGNPKSNCYLMGRQTVNWSINLKVPAISQSSIFTVLWTNHMNRTPVSITWGPWNQMMLSATIYITNVTPTVTTETMSSAALSAVTQGEISYVQL